VVSVTREALGGWLLRRRPGSPSLPALVSAGGLEAFCVRDNYRSELMRIGDLALLWISGRDERYERGIWASGRLEEEPGVDKTVPVRLTRLAGGPLTDRELRGHGIDDLEVQRQPFGSNPSWVSADQLRRIVELQAECGDEASEGWPYHRGRR
jgi:hypothetical protein